MVNLARFSFINILLNKFSLILLIFVDFRNDLILDVLQFSINHFFVNYYLRDGVMPRMSFNEISVG